MILGEGPATLVRFSSATTYDADGRAVLAGTTSTPIRTGIQPASGAVVQKLLEGERNRNGVWLYTKTKLIPSNARTRVKGDRVIVDGQTYEVVIVETVRDLLPHYKALALELQE